MKLFFQIFKIIFLALAVGTTIFVLMGFVSAVIDRRMDRVVSSTETLILGFYFIFNIISFIIWAKICSKLGDLVVSDKIPPQLGKLFLISFAVDCFQRIYHLVFVDFKLSSPFDQPLPSLNDGLPYFIFYSFMAIMKLVVMFDDFLLFSTFGSANLIIGLLLLKYSKESIPQTNFSKWRV